MRTLSDVLSCRALGCVRCGASATAAIMEEAMKREAAGKLADIDASAAQLGEGY